MQNRESGFLAVLLITILWFISTALPISAQETTPFSLNVLGSYDSGLYDAEAAEIVAFDPVTQRAFVVNGGAKTIDILDMSDLTAPGLIAQIDVTEFGGNVNSVAFHNGTVAAAIQAEDKQANGRIVFFDTDGEPIGSVEAGALPDGENRRKKGVLFLPLGGS